jgi:hypothetical protein
MSPSDYEVNAAALAYQGRGATLFKVPPLAIYSCPATHLSPVSSALFLRTATLASVPYRVALAFIRAVVHAVQVIVET